MASTSIANWVFRYICGAGLIALVVADYGYGVTAKPIPDWLYLFMAGLVAGVPLEDMVSRALDKILPDRSRHADMYNHDTPYMGDESYKDDDYG